MNEAKKKVRGIKIFAWLMLVVGVGMMLSAMDFEAFFAMYKFLPHGVVLALYSLSVVSTIVGVVAIIGILRLKDGMRKIAVAINIFDVLAGVPFFFFLNGIKQSCDGMAELAIQRNPSPLLSVDVLAKGIFYSAISAALGVMILNLLFIWYFTRPKVKEQFK